MYGDLARCMVIRLGVVCVYGLVYGVCIAWFMVCVWLGVGQLPALPCSDIAVTS